MGSGSDQIPHAGIAPKPNAEAADERGNGSDRSFGAAFAPGSDPEADALIRRLATEAATAARGVPVHPDTLWAELEGPVNIFDPDPAQVVYEPLRATFDYWRGLPAIDGVAQSVRVEPTALRPALGYLMLVDVLDDGADYRYALYGSRIAQFAGFDMTGKHLSAIPAPSPIGHFFRGCYGAVAQTRRPLYSAHHAPDDIMVGGWHRLILPLGTGRTVARHLVANVPVTPEGRMK